MAPITPRSDKLRVILLTGRPGVGKTTVVNRVYEHYSKNGFKVQGLTTREVREGVAALERSMKGAADLLIVDEIGPMEMTSASFRNSISRVLNGYRAVVATVKFGSRYPEVETILRKSLHWEITKENRESIYRRIIRQVDDWIGEPRSRGY